MTAAAVGERLVRVEKVNIMRMGLPWLDPEDTFLWVIEELGAPASVLAAFATVFVVNSWLALLTKAAAVTLSIGTAVQRVNPLPIGRFLVGALWGTAMTLMCFLSVNILFTVFPRWQLAEAQSFPRYFIESWGGVGGSVSVYLLAFCIIVTALSISGVAGRLAIVLLNALWMATIPGGLVAFALSMFAILSYFAALSGSLNFLSQFLVFLYAVLVLLGSMGATWKMKEFVEEGGVRGNS